MFKAIRCLSLVTLAGAFSAPPEHIATTDLSIFSGIGDAISDVENGIGDAISDVEKNTVSDVVSDVKGAGKMELKQITDVGKATEVAGKYLVDTISSTAKSLNSVDQCIGTIDVVTEVAMGEQKEWLDSCEKTGALIYSSEKCIGHIETCFKKVMAQYWHNCRLVQKETVTECILTGAIVVVANIAVGVATGGASAEADVADAAGVATKVADTAGESGEGSAGADTGGGSDSSGGDCGSPVDRRRLLTGCRYNPKTVVSNSLTKFNARFPKIRAFFKAKFPRIFTEEGGNAGEEGEAPAAAGEGGNAGEEGEAPAAAEEGGNAGGEGEAEAQQSLTEIKASRTWNVLDAMRCDVLYSINLRNQYVESQLDSMLDVADYGVPKDTIWEQLSAKFTTDNPNSGEFWYEGESATPAGMKDNEAFVKSVLSPAQFQKVTDVLDAAYWFTGKFTGNEEDLHQYQPQLD